MAEGERGPARPSGQSTVEGVGGARLAPAGSEPVPVGSVLGARYRLLEWLGRGAMGAVYRARDLTLDADIAIKVLDPDVAGDPKRVESFRNEVRVARKVTHPNVCRLHDLVEADGLWFITMQYVDGESLADRLRREGALPVADALRLLRDVAAGLAAAHHAGVVHRDLKPANVLLPDGEERAIVADFGIAAETARGQPRAVDVAGTRGYMSPEQAAGQPIDARSDVYGFGVLAHRMLTGELPWTAPTLVRATDVTGPPAGSPPDAPPALLGLIDECLAAAASDRPADGAALLARLSTPAALAAGSASAASTASVAGTAGTAGTADTAPAAGAAATSGIASSASVAGIASAAGTAGTAALPTTASTAGTAGTGGATASQGEVAANARPAVAALLPAASRRRRTRAAAAIGAAAVAAAALAALIWRPWAAAVAPPPAVPVPVVDEIAIDAAPAERLAPEEAHLVDSVVWLAIAELEDGWGMRGRARADGAPRAGPGIAELGLKLWVGRDRRLVLEAALAHGGHRSETRIESASLRQLAVDLAAWTARSLPTARLRPSAADLARTCTRSPEAWRLWRRARREARMQRWSQARELAGRAADLDRSFPLAPLELAFSYSGDDRALRESFARAMKLAGECRTLGREWQLTFEAVREVAGGDTRGQDRRLDEVLAMPDLDAGEKLYFRTRWAYGLLFGGEEDRAMPVLEWIADEWPTDAAVPKLLAHHHLEEDGPEDAATALRYARQALASAPHDVAVRADLARALLATGDGAGARAQAHIIERAEPAEKQSALAGAESDNTLVTLRLELGDWAEAERDARRLLLGPVTERNQGRAALGALELLRGRFSDGIDHLAEAHRDCTSAGIETTAAVYLWRAAWQSWQSGDLTRAADLFGRFEPAGWRMFAAVMLHVIAAQRTPSLRRAELARARAATRPLRAGSPTRLYLEMVIAHESRDWPRVLRLEGELRAAGAGDALGPMSLAGDALLATGHPREAAAHFARLTVHPRAWKEPVLAVRAWRRLGEVHEKLGDRAGAARDYQALLARWQRAPAGQPDVAIASARLARLGAAPR
ncbi:MAG TPA: protein kinase [Kofleriaceae bacterium]|nr:protein kinase [Kofleriaceae bacterium]